MNIKHKILFVCLGNICRSPTADAILHDMVEKRGIADMFEIDSAGTYAGHKGELPNPPMREAGTRRGYAMIHRSRPFVKDDFSRFDMILVMDEENYRNVSWVGTPEDMKKVYRMVEFSTRFRVKYVPDPYGEHMSVFEEVLDILEDACEGLLNSLTGKKV